MFINFKVDFTGVSENNYVIRNIFSYIATITDKYGFSNFNTSIIIQLDQNQTKSKMITAKLTCFFSESSMSRMYSKNNYYIVANYDISTN